eukprot:2182358-Amphidinium_carterae.2
MTAPVHPHTGSEAYLRVYTFIWLSTPNKWDMYLINSTGTVSACKRTITQYWKPISALIRFDE